MSNFIYYEKLEDYEEQVKKAKLSDEKDKEIERLNNIINGIDKFIDLALEIYNNVDLKTLELVKNKLQELKGSESNE